MDNDLVAAFVRYVLPVLAAGGIAGSGGHYLGAESQGATISVAQVRVVNQFAGKLAECMVKLEEAGGSMQGDRRGP